MWLALLGFCPRESQSGSSGLWHQTLFCLLNMTVQVVFDIERAVWPLAVLSKADVPPPPRLEKPVF